MRSLISRLPHPPSSASSSITRVVLAEYTATSGNFPTVTRVLLDKIPGNDCKMSYLYDKHVFHYVVEGGITYLCMADEALKRRVPFAYLADVKERFKSTFGLEQAHNAIAFAMNDSFSRVLQKQMEYHVNNPNADHIGRVQGQLEDVKGVMVQNIEKVLERGEKIELLVDKTDQMQQAAFKFEKSSKRLKNAMWWKNCRMKIMLGTLIVAVIVIIIAACGGFSGGSDKKSGSESG